jgi:DnaK suppressor protein
MAYSKEAMGKFEERLRQQQQVVEQSMIAVVEQGRDTDAEETNDSADQAVLSYQRELLFRQGSNVHSQLSLIRRALVRIADGSYGECIHCGNTIGVKRLEALPYTPSCIDCQEKIEKGELDGSQAA